MQWLSLQVKVDDIGVDKFKWYQEIIYFKIWREGWPILWCHSDEVVFTLDRASKGEDLGTAIGHSYTPSLVWPWRSCAPFEDPPQEKNVVRIQWKHYW